jgi:hypothetical protein
VNLDYGKDQSEEINQGAKTRCQADGVRREEALKIRGRQESFPAGRKPISIQ